MNIVKTYRILDSFQLKNVDFLRKNLNIFNRVDVSFLSSKVSIPKIMGMN